MKLRPYQKEAISNICKDFKAANNLLLVAATGAGKTVIFSKLAGIGKGRILVLAHRSELITQAANTLQELSGRTTSIEQGARHADRNASIIVASVQTMQRERLATWARDHFSLIICDEAHHAVSDSWQKVIAHFESAKVLGVTATPSRADNKQLGSFFEKVSYEIGMRELINAGFLSPLKWLPLKVSFDIRSVKVSSGKLNDTELGAAIEPGIQSVIDSIKEHAAGRRVLAFLPLVATSKEFVEKCNQRGIRAAHVDGTQSSEEREAIKRRLASGELDLVSNAMVWTEGFDCPEVDCILNLRPTKSVSLMQQMHGRGTRLSPATGKKDLLILDFLFEHESFNAVSPACLIAGSDVAEAMAKKVERGEVVDMFDVEKKAEQSLESFLRDRFDPSKHRGLIRYDDAIGMLGEGDLVGWQFSKAIDCQSPTTKQLESLKKLGIEPDSITCAGQAGIALDLINDRRERGFCTLKQMVQLYKTKHRSPRACSFVEAGQWLDRCFN